MKYAIVLLAALASLPGCWRADRPVQKAETASGDKVTDNATRGEPVTSLNKPLSDSLKKDGAAKEEEDAKYDGRAEEGRPVPEKETAPAPKPTSKPTAFPAPKPLDPGGPTLSDVKILKASHSPVKVVFSLRIQESDAPLGELWACLGGNVDVLKTMVGTLRKGLLSASVPGAAAHPCNLQKPTKASESWTAEVEFSDSRLLKSKVPVALLLDDERGRKSNPVVVEVDFGETP